MPGPWSGWWLGIVTLRRPECSVRWTRFEHHRDPGRPRSVDRLARCTAGCFKSRERLAHDPGAALGQRKQILTQPVDVLLDREATNLASFLAVTVPQLRDRAVAPKELRLDHQRGIAGPPADPNEIPVGGNGAVDQHHRRRTGAIFVDDLRCAGAPTKRAPRRAVPTRPGNSGDIDCKRSGILPPISATPRSPCRSRG